MREEKIRKPYTYNYICLQYHISNGSLSIFNVVRSFEMKPKNQAPNSQRLCPSYSYLFRYDQIVASLIVLLLLTTKWKMETKRT